MTIKPHNPEYYFEQCDPIIKQTFSKEQSKEIKLLLTKSMQDRANSQAKKINFNIWFIKFFYVTLFFGKEHRSLQRRLNESSKFEVFASLIGSLFSILFSFLLLFAIFLSLYYIKSFAGIDLFEKHLLDFLSKNSDKYLDLNELALHGYRLHS